MRTVSCAATALTLSPFTRAVFVTRCAVANTPARTLTSKVRRSPSSSRGTVQHARPLRTRAPDAPTSTSSLGGLSHTRRSTAVAGPRERTTIRYVNRWPPRTLARLAVLLTVTRVFPARTRSRTWARLLAAFASVLVDATVATLVRLPVRIGRTRSRIAARPPGAMSWSRHEIAGFRVHVPSLVRIDSTSARPVIASVTWTPVAVAGPAFDTVIPYSSTRPSRATPAIFEIARSDPLGATGASGGAGDGGGWPTVRSAAPSLLDGTGSGWSAVALATFSSVRPAVSAAARTVIEKSSEAPLARVPTAHVTVAPACVQLPAADTNTSPAGSVSATVTPVASLGPWLVSRSWNVAVPPGSSAGPSPSSLPVAGPIFVSSRSAAGMISAPIVSWLSSGSPSAWSAVTREAFSIVWPSAEASNVPTIVIVALPPLAIAPPVQCSVPPVPGESHMKPGAVIIDGVNVAGSGSVTATPVASSGPSFVTVSVYVASSTWPAVGFAGARLLSIARSADGGTSKLAVATLLPGVGSPGARKSTVAVLVTVVSEATTVATIVIVTVAFGAMSPMVQATSTVHVPCVLVATTSS